MKESEITASDFPPPWDTFPFDDSGADTLIKFCEKHAGKRVLIPKPDTLKRAYIRRLLIEDYETGGITLQAAADKYGVTLKTAFNYIKNHKKNGF